MIWILATRGAAVRLREAPFTETVIEGVESVAYRPGITPVPVSGEDAGEGRLGTFERGLYRAAGIVFSYDGSAAEALFSILDPVDLVIRYRAAGQNRRRTFKDVLFVGDSLVTLPGLNRGVSELVGVPFRVQIPEGETLAEHTEDALDP